VSRASTLTPMPAPLLDADLKKLMRALKLGRMLDTLPERLALAKQQSLPYADFLSLVFADQVERRDRTSADLRSRTAKLDPVMRLETFSSDSPVRYDKQLWNELCSLRFLDDARGALILGPVEVGKTHLATSLGHIAVRRRRTVKFLRADQMFRTLKAARLDNSVEVEMRALARVDVLIIDDFALQAMDACRPATSTNW
jgi:DNA replication protein DnaC